MSERQSQEVDPPKCVTCGDLLDGSPGNWYSLVTEMEQCGEPFHYHEPADFGRDHPHAS